MTEHSFEIPEPVEGWVATRMGDVAEIVGGGTPSTKDPTNFSIDEGFPWLTPADLGGVKDTYVTRGSRNLTAKGLRVSSARLMPKGTVLMSSRAPIGYVAIAANEISTNQGFKSFVCSSAVLPEYVLLWLKFINPLLQEMGSGSTFAEISGSRARQVPMLVAPLEEQKRIVEKVEALLGQVKASKDRLARVPLILRRFRQAVLAAACSGRVTEEWRARTPTATSPRELATGAPSNDLPDDDEHLSGIDIPGSWIRSRVDSLVRIQNGQAFPSKQYQSRGLRLLRPGNLHISGRVEWNDENTAHLPEGWAEKSPELVLSSGELLMNLTAQSLRDEFLGRVCLKEDNEPALLNQRIARFHPLGDFDVRRYLFIYFKSKFFRTFVNTLDTGSLIRHMHSKDVARHVVPLPPPEEQIEIVRSVGNYLALAEGVERRLTMAAVRIEKLPLTILAKAFRGELVPTEAELARAEGRDYESAEELLHRIAKTRATAELSSKRRRKAGAR